MEPALPTKLKQAVGLTADDEALISSRGAPLAALLPGVVERLLAYPPYQATPDGVFVHGQGPQRAPAELVSEWLGRLLRPPWDDAYAQQRIEGTRVFVRLGMPQPGVVGAIAAARTELDTAIERELPPHERALLRRAVNHLLDWDLVLSLQAFRAEQLAHPTRVARMASVGQLILSIGHDLRNPLAVMETSLFLLAPRLLADSAACKHAERIGQQITIATELVSRMLDLVREKPLELAPVSIQDVFLEAVSTVKRPPDVRIEAFGLDVLPEIRGDAGHLWQVVVNVLENAVQACHGGGDVTVSGRSLPGAIELAIEDTGHGVPAEVLPRLFEPLVSSKRDGVGLGLALVKHLVERHRGSITYAPHPGRGARFLITLPTP